MEHLVTNANSFQFEAQLYIFEDNEAVINMIIEDRSLLRRHVSRTHRVALDWLFDWINSDAKIPTTPVDTKNQFADMLAKVSFSRDERDHLLGLLNIMNFSIVSQEPFSLN